MALVTDGFVLRVSLVDNGGNTTIKTYDLRSIDHATALIDSLAVLAAIANVSESVVSAYSVNSSYKEDAFAYPAAGIENENKASLSVLLTTIGAKKANIKLPAPPIGIFQAASGPSANIVNVAHAAVVAYGALFAAGAECYISDGEDLDTIISGKRISAKKNNG